MHPNFVGYELFNYIVTNCTKTRGPNIERLKENAQKGTIRFKQVQRFIISKKIFGLMGTLISVKNLLLLTYCLSFSKPFVLKLKKLS